MHEKIVSTQRAMTEADALSNLVGLPVSTVERCAWGFENRTDVATLADGRRVVVQRISYHTMAEHKLRLAQLLPDRLAGVGIRLPRVLAADPRANPPYAVREYIPGEIGAALLRSDEGAIRLATVMGALLPHLARVATDGLRLHTGWSAPERLARQARQQLDRCDTLLDATTSAALTHTIDQLPQLFANRSACFAHGDFCPVNALIDERRTTNDERSDFVLTNTNSTDAYSSPSVLRPSSSVALLDIEFARLADPLFDAAWWGWVVRYHHPERWRVAWPHFLAAAGIPNDPTTAERIRALQQLRLLEALDYYAALTPNNAPMWVTRLVATIAVGVKG
jgi:aminoglycoside phosphotransferase (APT) family kinase protein